MTEIEQLRKELNELRERLVLVENRTVPIQYTPRPTFVPTEYPIWPNGNPYKVTCGS